jgi:hypothetical protein
MENTYETTTHPVVQEELRLAARNLQHLLLLKQETETLDSVTDWLQLSMIDAHANNPTNICDMMVMQAHIMDATFHHYFETRRNTTSERSGIEFAMKAQQQFVRTMLAWKKIKTETYVKNKIVKYMVPETATQKIPRGTD